MDVFYGLRYFFRTNSTCIDNFAFRVCTLILFNLFISHLICIALHYIHNIFILFLFLLRGTRQVCTKVTFAILIGCSLVVTSRQYIGDPIDCIVQNIPSRIMDTYCWFHSTYTLTNRMIGLAGRDNVQPGVASEYDGNDTITYHVYYQWVCFVLFFQALASHLPRYIWKTFEGNRIRTLTDKLNRPIIDDASKEKQKLATINYIKDNLNMHSFYAYRFFLCEFLNVIVAIGQFYVTNWFLGSNFKTYGMDVVLAMGDDFTRVEDPMNRLFPKMTKCTFYKYGPSGSIQKHDGLCVLSVNNINEKVYLFLWFWFIAMIFVSIMAFVYRLHVCTISRLRFKLLRTRARLVTYHQLEFLYRKCEVGDWFLLYQLSKNVDSMIFMELCRDLTNSML